MNRGWELAFAGIGALFTALSFFVGVVALIFAAPTFFDYFTRPQSSVIKFGGGFKTKILKDHPTTAGFYYDGKDSKERLRVLITMDVVDISLDQNTRVARLSVERKGTSTDRTAELTYPSSPRRSGSHYPFAALPERLSGLPSLEWQRATDLSEIGYCITIVDVKAEYVELTVMPSFIQPCVND